MSAKSNFSSFFEDWIIRQQAYLGQLEALLSPADGFDRVKECSDIIPRFVAHYQELYREKAKAAEDDVFVLISPPWLSSFERCFLWISGFRPSILFPIIERTVAEEMSVQQKQRIAAVKSESRAKEKEITQAMARVQETVAEKPVYFLMKKFGKLVDGEETEMDAAVEKLKAAMVEVMSNADDLQGWTVAEIVKILNPVQSVKFFAAVARFQLQARKWGLEKDCQRETVAGDDDF